MATAKRVTKIDSLEKRKKDAVSYGPRLREDSRELKTRVSKKTGERIEMEAKRYGMTISSYLGHAIRTFIDSGMAVKLIPE